MKKQRQIKVFKNLDYFREYEKEHNMGKWWGYDSDDFDGEYGPEYKDYIAICSYEYFD